MFTSRLRHMIFFLTGIAIILVMVACTSAFPTTPSSTRNTINTPGTISTDTSNTSTKLSSPSNAIPSMAINCPSTGTVRAAILPTMASGTQQAIIYLANTQKSASLNSYTIADSSTTTIANFANTVISDAQVSADGQWVLFVAVTNNQAKLQLVRVDGQDLQTLYCATPASNGASASSAIQNIQWSSNQQLVAFASYNSTSGVVDLLNMQNGTLEAVFVSGNGTIYPPVTWQDNTHLFLRAPTIDGPSTALYLLDTSKGVSQHFADLQSVYQNSSPLPCWDADSSYDGMHLFTSQCTSRANISGPGIDGYQGPDTISVQAMNSTTPMSNTIYTTNAAITQVRVISQNTLLFLVENSSQTQSIDTSQNGLWRIEFDGSQPMQLMSDGTGVSGGPSTLCPFSQYPWSNVSRDGNMYAIEHNSKLNTVQSLLFSSLNGGTPTTFVTKSDGTQLAIVGWTTT